MDGISSLFIESQPHTRSDWRQILFLFMLVVFISHTIQPALYHDAYHYFSYARSLVFDGDIEFSNEQRLLKAPVHQIIRMVPGSRPSNIPPVEGYSNGIDPRTNIFPPGSSILWSPFYLALSQPLNMISISEQPAGYDTSYRFAAALGTVFYVITGLMLIHQLLASIIPSGRVIWVLFILAFATPLTAYFSREPLQSEGLSFFSAAWLVAYSIRHRDHHSFRHHGMLGLIAGISALIRWQNVLLLWFPLLAWTPWRGLNRHSVMRLTCEWLITALVLIMITSPQILIWKHSPASADFDRMNLLDSPSPSILSSLFSLNRGLFTWSPLMMLGVFGLMILIRKDPVLGWACLLTICIQVYVNAVRTDWWGGAGFGARRYVACLPFFGLGLAYFTTLLTTRFRQRLMIVITGAAIILNLLLINSHYNQFDYPPSDASARELQPENLRWSLEHLTLLVQKSLIFQDLLRSKPVSLPAFDPIRWLVILACVSGISTAGFTYGKHTFQNPVCQAVVVIISILLFNVTVLFGQ